MVAEDRNFCEAQKLIEFAVVGGLHHQYERQAA
jgi:hypothetical protein